MVTADPSIADQVKARAAAIRAAYPDWPRRSQRGLLDLLDDRRFVPYPVYFAFDAEPLQPGEFGYAARLAAEPSEGYVLYLHPRFRGRDGDVALLLAYQLVIPIWDAAAGAADAELFGALLTDVGVDDYYQRICALADELAPPAEAG
jgi:hypothetical protein